MMSVGVEITSYLKTEPVFESGKGGWKNGVGRTA